MSNLDPLNPGEQELERQLRRLQPAGHRLNRDTLMFRAGQQATVRRLRRWQGLTGLALLLVATLAWPRLRPGLPEPPPVLAQEKPAPAPAVEVAMPVTVPSPSPAFRPSAGDNYLRLRNLVASEGWDALPAVQPVPAAPNGSESMTPWRPRARGEESFVPWFNPFQPHPQGDRS